MSSKCVGLSFLFPSFLPSLSPFEVVLHSCLDTFDRKKGIGKSIEIERKTVSGIVRESMFEKLIDRPADGSGGGLEDDTSREALEETLKKTGKEEVSEAQNECEYDVSDESAWVSSEREYVIKWRLMNGIEGQLE